MSLRSRHALRALPVLAASVLAASVIACGGASEPPVAPPASPAPSSMTPPASPPPAPVSAPAADPAASPAPVASAAPGPAQLGSKAVPIPGATSPVSYDYLVADRAAGRVYLAVGNTGSLDVFDAATGAFTRVDGFKTEERDYHGKKRMAGPSAATVGDGVVYVGNRATNEVCAVDAKTLKLGKCLKLPTPTDGVSYVASAKEVWVTTPHDQSLTVLDASKPGELKAKTVIKLGGEVEGYAVDDAHGLFFTNTEDKGTTLVVDVKSHKLRATWNPSCGSDGPRGVAVDSARGLLFVACTDHVQVLDAAHDGAALGKLDTGAGVDNLDYVDASGLLYVAAGKAAQITVARFDDKGVASVVAMGATAAGARNAVADGKGNAYVPDPNGAALLILGPK
jgi:DNA-binding beta-propeller fold protein YncE